MQNKRATIEFPQKKKRFSPIPSAGPSITEREINLVTDAVQCGWYENRNKHIDQFIARFSSYTGLKYCLPVCNCTAAIHLSLLSLGIGPGDEVIAPDITWVASVAPICYTGAKPVFVDIDPRSWCISPESFERAITKKTKAVVVVDLYGNMPQMQAIQKIAGRNKIVIIEDAAEAMGSRYNNQKAGTFGKINVFSFNATKLMMAGQGGMLATNEKKYYERAKRLSHHGMVKYTDQTTFWSVEIGYNYQWTNIQAALALAQLERLQELVRQRRQIFSWYAQRLSGIPGVQLNQAQEHVFSTYWVVTAIVDPKYKMKKEKLMAELSRHKIDTRPFFYPVSSQPAYARYRQGKNYKKLNPVAYHLSAHGISFPSAAIIGEADVDYVCRVFKKILNSDEPKSP